MALLPPYINFSMSCVLGQNLCSSQVNTHSSPLNTGQKSSKSHASVSGGTVTLIASLMVRVGESFEHFHGSL